LKTKNILNKYVENQNLEQDFEPSLIREKFGVTVGASSQKAGQRRAHHSCGRTMVWPHPAQGLLASAFGQRLVAFEGGAPPPAINSINREDPGWTTSRLSHTFFYSTLLHSLAPLAS